MKRLVVIAVAVACSLSMAGAALAVQSNTGCGLGSILFEGKDGLVSQVLAVTTNGTFGNITFGITSGTVNCAKAPTFISMERLNSFVGENMDNLALDMSKGSGEYLTTLAVLLDIPMEERAGFYGLMQNNFGQIYTSEEVTHVDVLSNIETILSAG